MGVHSGLYEDVLLLGLYRANGKENADFCLRLRGTTQKNRESNEQ